MLPVIRFFILLIFFCAVPGAADERPRARDIGVVVGTMPTGPLNAITDVDGVLVGHATRMEGDDIRTGVTAIIPGPGNLYTHPMPAWFHVGNGYGKVIGENAGPRIRRARDANPADLHDLRMECGERAERVGLRAARHGRTHGEPDRRRNE